MDNRGFDILAAIMWIVAGLIGALLAVMFWEWFAGVDAVSRWVG